MNLRIECAASCSAPSLSAPDFHSQRRGQSQRTQRRASRANRSRLACRASADRDDDDGAKTTTTRRSTLFASTSAAAALLLPAAARAAPTPSPTILSDPGAARAAAFAAALEKRVVEFSLKNGMRFIVLERPATAASSSPSTASTTGNAPVVSFVTYAAVGAFDEPEGQTGIAHLLEHMAFKGTSVVGGPASSGDKAARGSKGAAVAADGGANAAEEALLSAADAAFYELRSLKDEARAKVAEAAAEASAERKRRNASGSEPPPSSSSFDSSSVLSSKQKQAISAAEARLDAAASAADSASSSNPNAYGALLAREGALGLNPATSHDATRYYVSLPSNKLELWFALESGRFRDPVWRGLYTEKKVVAEERRARVESAPLGGFQQKFLRRALANNYGRPVIGYAEDVDRVGRRELDAFFRSRYAPSALTVAVVGDASASRVRQLAERYFGDWRNVGGPAAAASVAPPRLVGSAAPSARPQKPAERLVAAERGGPLVLKAYYRPAGDSPDAVAVDAAADVLSSGRSSRLYKALVSSRLALTAGCAAAVPGDLRPCASLLSAVPAPGVELEDVDEALTRAALSLAADGPTERELERSKKGARASLYSAARSNHGMASLLATAAGERGTWRSLLSDLASLETLTAEDVERAAGLVFAADGNGATAWAEPAAERVDIADVLIS